MKLNIVHKKCQRKNKLEEMENKLSQNSNDGGKQHAIPRYLNLLEW